LYYVTKYALTEGIWVVKPEDAEEHNGYLYLKQTEYLDIRIQVTPKDWFTDIEDAKKRVAQIANRKIKSVQATLTKLQNYEPPTKEWKP
jgi:hypothetical protein